MIPSITLEMTFSGWSFRFVKSLKINRSAFSLMDSSAWNAWNKPLHSLTCGLFGQLTSRLFVILFFLSPLFVSLYLFQQFCSREINGPPSCCFCACHLSDIFARRCARCCLNKRAWVCCVCMCAFLFVSLERVILWRVGSRRADKLFAKTNN